MDKSTASSRLRDLVKFLSTVRGDLANVTGPVSLLAPSSVVEVGQCWAQRPAVFAAPALEPCPERRSLLVLRLMLIALRPQLYVGCTPETSLRKPLNAFLGELFLARWSAPDGRASARLVAEQVSHHPPITAVHIADAENGVRADGYARVEMTFSGGVDVRQIGHALLRVDRYDEDYLIPLPDARVRGFLSGRLYPDITAGRVYTVVSSTGFVSEVRFSAAGLLLGGRRNSFTARLYHRADPGRTLYTIAGVWSEGWTVTDARTGAVLERYAVDAAENAAALIEVAPVSAQDPWESRRAWGPVLDALARADYRGAAEHKAKLEQAQRLMRAEEAREGRAWEPLLFRSIPGRQHVAFHRLAEGMDGWRLEDDRTEGVWQVDEARLEGLQRPFRRGLTPAG